MLEGQVLVDEGAIGFPLAAASFTYFMSNVEHVLNKLSQTVSRLSLVVLGARGVSIDIRFF